MRRRVAFGTGMLLGLLIMLLLAGHLSIPSGTLSGFVVAEQLNQSAEPAANSTESTLSVLSSDPAISEEQARRALLDAEQDILEMERAGIGTFYVRDLYAEAQQAFDGENITKLRERALLLQEADPELAVNLLRVLGAANGQKIGENYSLVLEKARIIRETKDDAILLLDELDALDLEVMDFLNTTTGINLSEVNETYLAARKEFSEERYANVLPLVNETYLKMEDARAEASRVNAMLKASKRTIPYYAKTHVQEIAITLVLLVIVGLVGYNEIARLRLKRALREIEIEHTVANEMIKKAQQEYYVDKRISQTMFTTKMDRYREKLLDLKEKKPVLEADLARTGMRRKYYLVGLKKRADA